MGAVGNNVGVKQEALAARLREERSELVKKSGPASNAVTSRSEPKTLKEAQLQRQSWHFGKGPLSRAAAALAREEAAGAKAEEEETRVTEYDMGAEVVCREEMVTIRESCYRRAR
jgi:hypothetical protein